MPVYQIQASSGDVVIVDVIIEAKSEHAARRFVTDRLVCEQVYARRWAPLIRAGLPWIDARAVEHEDAAEALKYKPK